MGIYSGGIIDAIGQASVITEIDHFIIHQGQAYISSDSISVPAKAGVDPGVLNIVIVNPTAFEVHLKDFQFDSTQGNATLVFYRNTLDDDNGTPLPLNNKNFKSGNISDAEMQHNPTNVLIGGATQIQHFGFTTGKKTGGTAASGAEEYVLKQNERCLLQYLNSAAAIDVVDYKLTTLNIGRLVT